MYPCDEPFVSTAPGSVQGEVFAFRGRDDEHFHMSLKSKFRRTTDGDGVKRRRVYGVSAKENAPH